MTDEPPGLDDPLAALRERIRATADAADRLAAEAGSGGGAGSVPPPRTEEAAQEAQALLALVGLLRDALPPELRQQVADLVRQVLLLVRAVIDWWVARLEPDAQASGSPDEPVVEEIPVD